MSAFGLLGHPAEGDPAANDSKCPGKRAKMAPTRIPTQEPTSERGRSFLML